MPAISSVALRDAAFSFGSNTDPLFSGLSVDFHRGFTGIVGANGAGKTTLLRALIGDLPLSAGQRLGPTDAVYCAQRTDAPPLGFGDFLDDWEGDACALKNQLQIEYDFMGRWHTLSHGERKRAQIAHALWLSPKVLAVDEPTNHIDSDARALLIGALSNFDGIGVIVSHDRKLLDALCAKCLWMDPPEAVVYSGGISDAMRQRNADIKANEQHRQRLLHDSRKLEKAEEARRKQASSEHKQRSKKGLGRKDSDARDKINRARVSDGNAGSGLRQFRGRREQLARELADTTIRKTYTTGIQLNSDISRRSAILRLDAGRLQISEQRSLTWPDITVRPQDRIALTGPNGAGKSSWIKHMLSLVQADPERVMVIPQETTASMAQEIHRECLELSSAELGRVMQIVSRLNSRPSRLLASHQPSPGESKKLAIALGMSRSPQVIVMDEPTNHLDLPSTEALERALLECRCAIIVVTHDEAFINNIEAEAWRLEINGGGVSTLVTEP